MDRRNLLCGFGLSALSLVARKSHASSLEVTRGSVLASPQLSLRASKAIALATEPSPTEASAWPSSVAGVALPDSKIARQATDLARTVSPPYLFNHCVRTFLWGSLAGRAMGKNFDEEMLYLACILHDLGLTDRYRGDSPFEIQGAKRLDIFSRTTDFRNNRRRLSGTESRCTPLRLAASNGLRLLWLARARDRMCWDRTLPGFMPTSSRKSIRRFRDSGSRLPSSRLAPTWCVSIRGARRQALCGTFVNATPRTITRRISAIGSKARLSQNSDHSGTQ